jgi:hypothetical protein
MGRVYRLSSISSTNWAGYYPSGRGTQSQATQILSTAIGMATVNNNFLAQVQAGRRRPRHAVFKEPVFHMFDFLGNGSEQVITLDRTVLRVYGYRNPPRKAGVTTDASGRVVRNAEYVRKSIANHTHY